MRITTRKRDTSSFAEYGLTADDVERWHRSVKMGEIPPASETQARIERWVQDKSDARRRVELWRAERRRRSAYGFWTVVGIASIVAVTISVIAVRPVHLGAQAAAGLMTLGLVCGLVAAWGRDYYRKQ